MKVELRKTCLFCKAPMIVVTESRHFRTYACSNGCTDYTCEEEIEQGVFVPIHGLKEESQCAYT